MNISKYPTENKVYRIVDSETHLIIAPTLSQAIAYLAESNGYDDSDSYLDDCQPISLSIESPDKELTVLTEDDGGEIGEPMKMTAAGWTEHESVTVGILGSTDH